MLLFDKNAQVRSFYIHWPFCPYRCHFCPFVALASHDEFMEDYHQALLKEIEQYLAIWNKNSLDTIYFGGGTPSTYPKHLLLDTFGRLRKNHLISADTEITIEVNPGTVDKDKLLLWKELGINRLSIGVQSLNSEVLHSLNRLQNTNDVLYLIEEGNKLFDNLSIDLILGLPNITIEEWKKLIQTVVKWPIKHLSTYFLTVHENTRLYFGVKQKQIILPNDDEIVELYLWTIGYLAKHDFRQYETSSFAKPGFECKHNQMYWSHKPYKAFGLGACSFDGLSRFQNEKNLMQYLEKVNKEFDLSTFSEKLNQQQLHLEKLMLGMRQMDKGISIDDLTKNLSATSIEKLWSYIHSLRRRGIIRVANNSMFLTTRGLSVENEIVVNLSSFSNS